MDERLPETRLRPKILHEAMRYSVLGGGKRIRPILCLAVADMFTDDAPNAMDAACSLELLHCYTLVHDDLPAMDDDELRRGHPSAHIQFGEANAILAGDALLTLAFEIAARCPASKPYPANQILIELARAGGSRGVVGGQTEDLSSKGNQKSEVLLHYIHTHKTAALLRAAVRIGAINGGAEQNELEHLSSFGSSLGLAFQVIDDILDCTAKSENLGKPARSDEQQETLTYPSLYGLEAAYHKAAQLTESARQALGKLQQRDTSRIFQIADYLLKREY